MKQFISCPNCNGSGKVSGGIFIDEQEDNIMHRYEVCPICHGEGIIRMLNGSAKWKIYHYP